MSVYDRRYHAHANHCSHYTDDPREALAFMDRDPDDGWCVELVEDSRREHIGPGHLDFRGIEGARVTRGRTRRVTRETLRARIADADYLAYRASVRRAVERLRGGDTA